MSGEYPGNGLSTTRGCAANHFFSTFDLCTGGLLSYIHSVFPLCLLTSFSMNLMGDSDFGAVLFILYALPVTVLTAPKLLIRFPHMRCGVLSVRRLMSAQT
jgi:hypothetical protein